MGLHLLKLGRIWLINEDQSFPIYQELNKNSIFLMEIWVGGGKYKKTLTDDWLYIWFGFWLCMYNLYVCMYRFVTLKWSESGLDYSSHMIQLQFWCCEIMTQFLLLIQGYYSNLDCVLWIASTKCLMWLAFIGNLSFEEGSSLGQIYVFVDVQGHLCNLVLSAIFDAMLL